MEYRMKIISEVPTSVYREDLRRFIETTVGRNYIVSPIKTTTIKDRKNSGRKVVVLGFTVNFSPTGAIIRYLDTGRRGIVSPTDLLPIG